MRRHKNSLSKGASVKVQVAKHPGEVLFNEFMGPVGLTASRLALTMHVTPQRVGEIINCRRGITAETALRLSKLFKTTPKYWLDLQTDYELYLAKERWAHIIDQEISHGFTDITRTSLSNTSGNTAKQNQDSFPKSVKLTDSQKSICDLLSKDLIHFDVLTRKSGMSVSELAATLTILELSGLTKRHPGNRYSKLMDCK